MMGLSCNMWALLSAVAGAAPGTNCAGTGQGYPCWQQDPGFNWQPQASALSPDPLLAGNSTFLWLSDGDSCSRWYGKVEDFLLSRVEQNRFLSTAIPGCGHALSAGGGLLVPQGADVATLARINGQMHSLKVAVTPVIRGSPGGSRALLHSSTVSHALVTALVAECSRHGYDGYVLQLNVSQFGPADDEKLGALLLQLQHALGPRRSVAAAIPAARPSTSLAKALNGSGVTVHITEATTPVATDGDMQAFSAALAAAVEQFGPATSVGLTMTQGWWGGTGVPSIVDVTNRLAVITQHNVQKVALDVDWASAAYQRNQAMLDLWQLGMLTGFRSGAGMNWETLSPPRDGSAATRAAWGADVKQWKESERRRLGFEGVAKNLPYDDPQLNWTRANFVSPQVMLHDRYLFDRATGCDAMCPDNHTLIRLDRLAV